MSLPAPDPRIPKLPVWAQDYIQDLQRELRHAHDLVVQTSHVTNDYNAPGLHLGSGLKQHRLVPWDDVRRARLVLPAGSEFTLLADDLTLQLQHLDRAGKRLAIMPNASNSVDLTSADR